MSMDSSSAQDMGSQTLESMVVIGTKAQQEKKSTIRVGDQQPQNCPRCDSTNTKFCYYNNYSLSQPRYFCKSCRRYWTKGGTLRNVPVGGGCRKNKRSSSSSSSKRSSQDNNDQPMPTAVPSPNIPCFNNPHPSYDSNDHFSMYGNPNMPLGSVFDALRGGILETPRGFQNLYYGMGDGISLGMGISSGLSQEMGAMGFDQDFSGATAAKQEICGGGGESSRGMWGFPWQNGSTNGGDGNIGEFDSGRVGGWNGIASSNWHGLLNSPLM